MPHAGGAGDGREIADSAPRARNLRFYDGLWSHVPLAAPERFNTWQTVSALLAGDGARMELAPGLRPRLPVAGTVFVDISRPALARLRVVGGAAAQASAAALPLPDGRFALLAAFDVLEHLEDDEAAMAELARIARPGARLLLSAPLHPCAWTEFDRIVGHVRRYEPARLAEMLARHGFAIERSAAFGMRPRASALVRAGMWFLARHPGHAMTWYNRVLFPLALRRQRPLRWQAGMLPSAGVGDVVMVCRRAGP